MDMDMDMVDEHCSAQWLRKLWAYMCACLIVILYQCMYVYIIYISLRCTLVK